MIAQQGQVVAITGDHAVVRIGGTSGCAACDAGKGCGAGVFGRLLRNRQVTVEVPNRIGAGVGQAVELGISEQRFLALVLRLYALPLLAGLLGAMAGFEVAIRLGFDGFAADAGTLAAGLLAAGGTLSLSRRSLREFPMRSAVHLLQAAKTPESVPCTGLPRGDQQRREPVETELKSLER